MIEEATADRRLTNVASGSLETLIGEVWSSCGGVEC